MASRKKSPIISLLAIYVLLMVLLGLTIVMAALPLGALGLLVALVIAAIKSILVMLFFMHLLHSSRVTWLFAGAGFVWLVILFSLTFSEYIGRSSLSRMQPLNPPMQQSMKPEGG